MTIQELIAQLEQLRAEFGPDTLVRLSHDILTTTTHYYRADRDQFVVVLG